MRTQFINTEDGSEAVGYAGAVGRFINADGDEFDTLPGIVVYDAPWASVAVEVEGGYMAFESVTDYETWNNQK